MPGRADQRGLGQRQPRQVERAPGPAGQQRRGGRREQPVRRPGDDRQRRVEQQEPGRGPGLRGAAQLRPVLPDPVGQLGLGARRVGHAQPGRDPGHVGDVAVPARLVQRMRAEPAVRAQEAVRLGDVHPGQQVRVGRRVRAAVRRDAGHPAVDVLDPIDRFLRVAGPAERGHGQEVAGPLQPPPGITLVPGMGRHRGHGQRVQRLQQQRADAADEHGRVAVHPADRPVRGEPPLAAGLVNHGPAVWPLGARHPLEDRRPDPAAHRVRCVVHPHLITTGICPVSPLAPTVQPAPLLTL